MTDMPWRLQLAMAAMQGDCALHNLRSEDVDVEQILECRARKYFRMADAMLAEHERTAKVAPKQTDANNDRLRTLITDLRASGDVFQIGMFRDMLYNAADELERMLNEK